MNIVKKIDQYNENNIFFCDPIKNNVMNDGVFIRIIYSNDRVVINGVYLLVDLNDITCEKYYSKYKCHFNINTHKHVIETFKHIEEELLRKYKVKDKTAQFKIYEQLKNGNIKIFTDIEDSLNSLFVLKISGIWETSHSYGLTFKFLKSRSD